MNVLNFNKFKCNVSSVLNRDVKQHGKQFMFDNLEDTSWSSDQGTPQVVHLIFEDPVSVSGALIQFQGGFVGQEAKVILERKGVANFDEENIYPEDNNAVQEFKLSKTYDNVCKIQLNFGKSSDFFGRIIIYKLEILANN